MKWLLLLLIVLGGVWWLRRSGRGQHPATPSSPPATPGSDGSTRPMTQCLQCGLHLPLEDAVQGQRGPYCSPAHRQQHEA
jgi:uncharacterized protein